MLDNGYVRNNEIALSDETITKVAKNLEVAKNPNLRRSTRTRRMLPYLENYHHQLTTSSQKRLSSTLSFVL